MTVNWCDALVEPVVVPQGGVVESGPPDDFIGDDPIEGRSEGDRSLYHSPKSEMSKLKLTSTASDGAGSLPADKLPYGKVVVDSNKTVLT
jgi:hypothetical protein